MRRARTPRTSAVARWLRRHGDGRRGAGIGRRARRGRGGRRPRRPAGGTRARRASRARSCRPARRGSPPSWRRSPSATTTVAVAATPNPEVVAALTKAERRVAEAVAAGRTNREVADHLFVSVKTVDFHLQAIYRKLGVRSRTELAVLMATRSSRAEGNERGVMSEQAGWWQSIEEHLAEREAEAPDPWGDDDCRDSRRSPTTRRRSSPAWPTSRCRPASPARTASKPGIHPATAMTAPDVPSS